MCNHCHKPGHTSGECFLRNPSLKSQPNAKKAVCTHCHKPGHTVEGCFLRDPSLRSRPKAEKTVCTHCQKTGHTSSECFQRDPSLKSQRKGAKQQTGVVCSYCSMPHKVEACWVLNPALKQPEPQQPTGRGNQPQTVHPGLRDPPPRLTARIRQAEALAKGAVPQGIRKHSKVRRIQGWYPAMEVYFTLPLYGVAVSQPATFSNAATVNYEAYDIQGDLVMCNCGHPEGVQCYLEHWIGEAVGSEKGIKFTEQGEEAFKQIMKAGLVDYNDIGVIS